MFYYFYSAGRILGIEDIKATLFLRTSTSVPKSKSNFSVCYKIIKKVIKFTNKFAREALLFNNSLRK